MSKQDLYIILAVVVLGGALWLGFHQPWQQREDDSLAVITVDGTVIGEKNLRTNAPKEQFTVAGKNGNVTLETEGGGIRIVESPCPDQTCVKTGRIEKKGQAIVCVPNHLVIKIQTGEQSGLDAVVY